MTVAASLDAARPVLRRAGDLGWWRRGYVSTAFGCPYTGAVAPARAVEVALRLLDLGVDEVCFGDTIGVGVPGQVARAHRRGRGRRDPARPDRVPLPRHPRDGPRQRRGRPRRRRPLLRFRGRRDRRLSRTRPAPPATSRPRTSCTSSTRPAATTASTSAGVLAAARFAADALGKPLATKVGQAGGWDPATGATRVGHRRRRPSARAVRC